MPLVIEGLHLSQLQVSGHFLRQTCSHLGLQEDKNTYDNPQTY